MVPALRNGISLMLALRQSAVLISFAFTLSGCGGSPTAPGDVPYGQRFDLRQGQRLTVGDDGLAMTFQTVKSDARCPLDATCIDIGNAVIALTVELSGRSESRDIHTKPPLSTLTVDSYAITLDGLQPYPWSNRPVVPADYTAQLTVVER
jgi:hypothetical protein